MNITRLIYGGSFNPVHKGHLATIEYVLANKICLEVFIIPAYQSPFKNIQEYAPAEIRFEMLQYAIQSYFSENSLQHIHLLDIEIKEKKVNFTANTLKKLSDNIKTGILIGADSLPDLHRWREIEWILTYYPFYIVMRKNIKKQEVNKNIENLKGFFPMGNFIVLDFYPPSCSSTEIRNKVKYSHSYEEFKNCLLPETYSIIRKNKLYLD